MTLIDEETIMRVGNELLTPFGMIARIDLTIDSYRYVLRIKYEDDPSINYYFTNSFWIITDDKQASADELVTAIKSTITEIAWKV